MKKQCFKRIIMVLAVVAIIPAIIMLLWNWLMPTIFGIVTINYWQAIGLFILSRILFGKLGGWGPKHHHHRNALRNRWETMTPEEREQFMKKHRQRMARHPLFNDLEDEERKR